MRPSAFALFLLAVPVGLTLSPYAFAQSVAPKEDLTTLEKNLASESAALSTSDCVTACKALGSIRRAAEKICALDPDERCIAARAKADDATRRVRDACPDCAIASAPVPSPKTEERAMGKGGSRPATPAPDAEVSAQSAPPAMAPGKRGCGSCASSGATPGDLSSVVLAIAGLAFALRRRPKK